MKFYINKIKLTDSVDKLITLDLTPYSGLHASFIKLSENKYVSSGELLKNGYHDTHHPVNKDADDFSPRQSFYLDICQETLTTLDDMQENEIGKIQHINDREDFNYKYESEIEYLNGKVYLSAERFNDLWTNLTNKTFPTYVHLFIDTKYTEKYEYHYKYYTPWDLSELKTVPYFHSAHPSVAIEHIRIEYELLKTNEFEFQREKLQRDDELWDLEHKAIYLNEQLKVTKDTKDIDVLITISKQLGFLNVYIFVISIIFLLKTVF